MRAPRRLRPRQRPQQTRATETRERILEVAARLFDQDGYAGTTTNRIAESAFLSIGTLYRYFPNKDAILVELATRHIDDGARAVAARLARGLPDSLDAALAVAVRLVVDNHRGRPRLHRVLFEEAPRPPALLQALHAAEAGIVAGTVALLRSYPEVRVADTQLAARVVVATVESLVHRLYATDDPVDPDALAAELVTLLGGYLRGGGRQATPDDTKLPGGGALSRRCRPAR